MPAFRIAALLLAGLMQTAAAAAPEAEAVKIHVDRAAALAGDDYFVVTARLQCSAAGAPLPQPGAVPPPGSPADPTPVPPTRVFDNLYYVGLTGVGAWAVTTRDGIVLIDALNNSADARDVIIPGLRALGLDPATIKYVIVTHGHGDHYGGARYLTEASGARIIASAADWQLMSAPESAALAARFGAPPARDIVATDGMVLDVGGTKFTLVETPGHTPGTLSLIVPVFDRGRPHMAALWGGTGLPRSLAARRDYLASVAKFDAVARRSKVDVEISNHGFVDDALRRMAMLRADPAGPNPFVIGAARYARYTGVIAECARAGIARLETAQ